MSAHLREIVVRTCTTCGRRATVTLHNTFNAEIGDYCATHGRAALKSFQQRHESS